MGLLTGLTQLLVEALAFMSWRAAVGGEAIPQMMEETASAVYYRLAATQSRGTAQILLLRCWSGKEAR